MSQASSSYIQKAKSIIDSAKNRSLSINERAEMAISLAALLLEEAQQCQTSPEKARQNELGGMLNDSIGKVWLTLLTDQCFRSANSSRAANQLTYILNRYGIPDYLPLSKKIALRVVRRVGSLFSSIFIPLTVQIIRKETSSVILPGEKHLLYKHIRNRVKEGVEINLNHLGEAILGEEEARRRLQLYLDDLSDPTIQCVSIKISTLYSQINLIAWEETLEILSERLRTLYREAMKNPLPENSGKKRHKSVNLDMEEYRDLYCTVALFQKVLDEPEFHDYDGAGIALQSYLPDSFAIQQKITEWAMQRVAKGRSPVKIRIVKGANLAMEQVESAVYGWPQAPYTDKADVDANYKKMVTYGCKSKHAKAVHLGIASHNLFDISYALLLRAENRVENEVIFEMLEGMADHIRRSVQQLCGRILLYCPAASKEEFQNAVAYLVRRLDENTAPENFLRHAFNLTPGSDEWRSQASRFTLSCCETNTVYTVPRRQQNRLIESYDVITHDNEESSFQNEPDTDFSLPQHRIWVEQIINEWKDKNIETIPLVIGGKEIVNESRLGIGIDPSYPDRILYHYSQASAEEIDQALKVAKNSELQWSQVSVKERSLLLKKIARGLREGRTDLIGAMIAGTGKTVVEADSEISEAIDFAEYYRYSMEQLSLIDDIQWSPKGTVLVTPPWNFPCAIPAGGILAGLVTGNCVIFKPSPEAVLVGWELVQIFWRAGISKDVLQWISCKDNPEGSLLIKDPRVSAVVLTGATETAKLFLKMRPGLDLIAETGGKNAMIITALADRDLAIKSLLHSAFGHAGQKCSACSLAILEAEVYDDIHFRQHLRDAAASLTVGSAWSPKTKVNPLISNPNPNLMRALTTLEKGEEWLLEPKVSPDNPQLWSPGIKLGVKQGSFTFENELFGPVLALVRANDLVDAIKIANSTPYGLTAGLQSLDDREQKLWAKQIIAGNCYINRSTTGAIVQRQPFGGCKESSFGRGIKAGGPNYLTLFMNATQTSLPPHPESISIEKFLPLFKGTIEEQETFKVSLQSYIFYMEHYFSKADDPSLIIGQDNLFHYKAHDQMTFRVQSDDTALDIARVVAAAQIAHLYLEVSSAKELPNGIKSIIESDKRFIERVQKGEIKRVRLLKVPSKEIEIALANAACRINLAPVMTSGRLEILHYLREISWSFDYHRYGNLGAREQEKRRPLVDADKPPHYEKEKNCGYSCQCE